MPFNFYNDINRNWIKTSKIPTNASSFSIFDILEKEIQGDMIKIIKDSPKTTKFGQLVSSIYEGRSNDLSFIIEFIDSLNLEDIFKTFGLLNIYGLRTPIKFNISNDSRNTERYALYLEEPDLTLIKEEYKTKSELYKKYGEFLDSVGQELGDKTLGAKFLNLETHLSTFYYDYEENFIIEKIYNPMTYSQICKEYPLLQGFFSVLGVPLSDINIIVVNPKYLKEVYHFIKNCREWPKLIKMYVILSVIEILPEPFTTLHFNFLYKFMLGQKTPDSKDYKAFQLCSELCEDTLGLLYVKSDLPKYKKIRKAALELFHIVMKSASASVKNIGWLSESSRKIAIYKLGKMKSQIAYPDVWLNELNCPIDSNCFAKNLLSIKKYESEIDCKRLFSEPTKLWDNSCYTVNAFYYTELNLLCIPLGFIRPPFFSLEQSFVQNLAGLGNIMAHEMAHGFDEEGRKYDEKGNYKPWWVSIDIEMYKEKTKKLVELFNKEKYHGLSVDGELTLGENLADFGAMAICLQVIKERGLQSELREFFSWYAKTWIYKETKAKREQAIKKDRHAPAETRVNVVIRHFQEFYDAFSIKEGDPGWIAPNDRINIWS